MDHSEEKKPTLLDQVKAAERDKYLAEAEKARAEKEKIEYEVAESKIEANKPWILKKGRLPEIVIIITVLSFLYEFVAKPIANRDNIVAQTSIAYSRDSLRKATEKLDSSKRKQDTLKVKLNLQQRVLTNMNFVIKQQQNQLNETKRQVDSIARLFLLEYKDNKKTKSLYNALNTLYHRKASLPTTDIFKGQQLNTVHFIPSFAGKDFEDDKFYIFSVDGIMMPNIPANLKGPIRLPDGQYIVVLVNSIFKIEGGTFMFDVSGSTGMTYPLPIGH